MPPVTIILLPYLPLRDRAEIGPFCLIPAQELSRDQVCDDEVWELASGLLRLYRPERSNHPKGAVLAPDGGLVGEPLPEPLLGDLRRAVVSGLLEGNPPSPAFAVEDDPNAGSRTASSDNAVIWGHPLTSDGYTSTQYGWMVSTLSGGHNVLHEEQFPISPPLELPSATLYGHFDAAYAQDVFDAITGERSDARSIARTIDWLDAAWRNTSSLGAEVRVALLRSGFEVLFQSEDTFEVRDRLGALLDPTATKVHRQWSKRNGQPTSAPLSGLEWWFQCFAFLRNKIMHGEEISPDDFVHEGAHHVWLGEHHLRSALRARISTPPGPAAATSD